MVKRELAKLNAERILAKYADGPSYLVSEWKGNDALEPGEMFLGDADGPDGERKTFECLSNEMVLKNGFRQTTKGIEVDLLKLENGVS
ncbi:MAG: hypothetical protein FWD58_11065 [Firmicutes bacterium]|nr:hypothetical protein [Bacillota bacterium]